MFKDKFNASIAHLLLSAIIITPIVLFIYFIWYPFPLAKAVGLNEILLLIFTVDLILGPLFTFIIYRKGKKSLKVDLFIIAFLQFSALFYGIWIVYQGKPEWIVFNVDRFDVVRHNEIDYRNIGKAKAPYNSSNLFYPKWVAAHQPNDNEIRTTIMFESIFAGVDIAQRPELYVDLMEQRQQIQKTKKNIDELLQFNEKTEIEKILKQNPKAKYWLPIKASSYDMAVFLDENGDVLKIVDLRPWL